MTKQKKIYDYLIVGAGFSGSVLARMLAENGNKKILLIDKRNHIGGNCYDYYNDSGVLVHKYGPHYFRTDDKEVWNFLSKFTEWRFCQYIVKTFVNGQIFDFPINLNTINQFFGTNFSSEEAIKFIKRKVKYIKCPKNAEEQVISKIGQELYQSFFRNYTIKQWGIDPKYLDASVTARIPIRFNKDPRYFESFYQAMPKEGYCKIFERMLNHKNITVWLNTDFFQMKKIFYNNLIYTGCIDEFFNYKFGKLSYRSLKFEFETFDQEFYQQYSQINYPNEYDFTRVVEIKHVTGQKIKKTTIVREYPLESGEPFYPIPTKKNEKIYKMYQKEAKKKKNIFFIGRLAKYKYLNMDQVIKEALNLSKYLINEKF